VRQPSRCLEQRELADLNALEHSPHDERADAEQPEWIALRDGIHARNV
jgi:hypothetical protein